MKTKFSGILTLLLAFVVQITFAQEKTISGTVTDETGPLPGVSIIIKGTTTGTETDFDGKYAINANAGDVLVFSFVGMSTQQKTVGTANVINVVLVTDNILEEVVVVAYGTSSKEAITGAVHQIKAEDIGRRPLANISQAIEGSTPGVLVTTPSGQPGSGQAIRIRGFGSFGSSNAPLYVVDGIPINGDLSSLNTQDIESVTILKDASSTALYGNKGANGVILVTTKRGKSLDGELTLNVSTGAVSRGNKEYDRLNASDYYEAFWESRRNANAIPGIDSDADVAAANLDASENIINNLGNNPFNVPDNQIVGTDGKINPNAQLLYPDDLDWEDAISRTGVRKNVDLSYNQRTEKGDYFASFGYLDEQGYINDSDFTRATARINANYQAKPWLKVGININGRISEQNQAQTAGSNSFVNPFRFTRGIGPIYNIYQHDASGAFILDANGNRQFDLNDNRTSNSSTGRHIVAEIALDNDIRENNNLTTKAYAEIKLLEGLTFTANGSYEVQNFYRSRFRNPLVGDGAPGGDAFKQYVRIVTKGFNQLLNYSKSFNDKHNFDLLAGHESQAFERTRLDASKDIQIFGGNEELGNFVTLSGGDSQFDEKTDDSYFGRLNYNFDGKYFLSASIRTDGTSILAEEKRWGTFWSFGASWSLDKEAFIQDASWIDQLKLRASIGEVGNNNPLDQNGNPIYYAYQGLLDLGFDNASEGGVVLGSKANPNLKWETVQNSDLALEFGFFNRLRGSVEYYNKKSIDLIFSVPLPLSAGGTQFGDSQSQNVGELFNRGIEVGLSYDIINKEDFRWTTTVNASTLKNEFTKLPPGQDQIINGTKQLEVGKGLFDYWIRDWYGVDPSDGSGLFVADDATASGVRTVDGIAVTPFSNNAKFHYAGTVIPDLFGSINTNFRYKRFNLDFLFTYQIGGDNLDFSYAGLLNSGAYGGGLHEDILNRWRQPGDITDIPRNDAVLATQWQATSDRFLHDASYLSLRQINFSYDMPESLITKIGLSTAQIYANAENVFNINKRRGFSQQQAFSGNTSNVFEPSKVFTVGLNLKF